MFLYFWQYYGSQQKKKNLNHVIDQSFPVSRPITALFGAALLKQACILLVPS